MAEVETDRAALVRRFRSARRDRTLAVLEGFHALKHALRFGAEVEEAVAADLDELERLAADLAPDLAEALPAPGRDGRSGDDRRAGPAGAAHGRRRDRPPARGRRRRRARRRAPGAAGPARGAADDGQHGRLRPGGRRRRRRRRPHHRRQRPLAPRRPARGRRAPLRAAGRGGRLDPRGRPAPDRHRSRWGGPASRRDPPRSILAFGTERHGLSSSLLERADARVGIPMREGVSSLNLATSVAAVLFSQRV